jgi:hypothetical protein
MVLNKHDGSLTSLRLPRLWSLPVMVLLTFRTLHMHIHATSLLRNAQIHASLACMAHAQQLLL